MAKMNIDWIIVLFFVLFFSVLELIFPLFPQIINKTRPNDYFQWLT